jgi:hypothetical protein
VVIVCGRRAAPSSSSASVVRFSPARSSGLRVSAIDRTLIGDYDERRRRLRLRRQTTKTKRALWIDLPDELADALEATLPPRENRDP